jgi:hypothetical protein
MTASCLTFARRLSSFAAVAVLACAGVAGCAMAAPYNPSRLPAAELGQVREICRTTLGIPAGFGLSTSCVEGLSRSMAALDQSRGLAGARERCMGKGLQAGDPGLGECELSAAFVRSAATPATATANPARPSGSYFNAARGEIRRREQLACARLGLDPTYPSFATCMVRLDSALSDAEHAAH